MKISKKDILELLILLLLGFTPLLWFHGNEVILGHDAGLPLSPVLHFLDRLHVWTDRYGFGYDQSLFLPGFFIHGIEAIVFFFFHSLQMEQKITFIFWFVLPGITMYYFANKIAKKYDLQFFALPSAIFYMFNHFLLQGWFIAERTKFSLYAALPLLLAFLFDWQDKQRSTSKSAIFIAITFFFLNGEGSLPLFGGILMSLFTFVIFYFLPGFSVKKIFHLIGLIGLTVIASVLLNAYWLFSYLHYISHSFLSEVAQAGGLNGILGWLNYVSADSSLINLLRLQGIPEWYQNPLHPYANTFLGNPILIAISCLIPVLAFLPLLVVKGKVRRFVIFFSFLAIFSIIFAAGSHPPFGTFYILLVNFLPGFIAFRTPFYKFSPAVWFSYALLISFSINYFLERFRIQKVTKYLLLGAFCTGIILYSYPLLTGSFFNYVVGQRSNKVSVPSYVFDFAKWSDATSRSDIRTLVLPRPNIGNNIEAYTWGYWSPSPLTTLLTNAPIVNPTGLLPGQEYALVENVYDMMKNNTPGWKNYAKSLGIQSFLLRNDFAWNLKESPTDSPQDYTSALKSDELTKIKTFGEWDVYDFKDQDTAVRIQSSNSLSYIVGTPKDMDLIAQVPNFNGAEPYYIAGDPKKKNLDILQFADSIYIKPVCIHCNLQNSIINLGAYVPLITRSSRFYKVISKLKKPSAVSISDVAYDSLRNLLEFQKVIDEGKNISITLPSLQEYLVSLNILDKALHNFTQHISQENNSILLDIQNVLRNEKIVLVQKNDQIKDPELLNFYVQIYQKLGSIKVFVDSAVWTTSDEIHKRFFIESPMSESYAMLVRPDDIAQQGQKVSFVLDDTKYQVNPKQVENNLLFLGQYPLKKGIHKLDLEEPAVNLYTGPQDFNVSFSPEGSCFFSDKLTGNKNQIVRVSFQHKKISGMRQFTVLITKDNQQINSLNIQGDQLRSNASMQNYLSDYAFNEDGESFYFAICAGPSADTEEAQTDLELQNLNIRKLYSPDILFYTASNQNSQATIPYIKQSAYNYEFNGNNANNKQKILIFKETYSDNWRLNNKSSDFMVNGFATAWISNNGDKKSIIIYVTQNLVIVGFIVTTVAIMGSIVLVLFLNKK